MKTKFKILLILSCFFYSIQSKADSWIDPTWKRMLDESDAVVMVEYTSSDDFQASAKILKVYKGTLKIGEEIFISNFSNRYGPIDTVRIADKYIVFLKLNKLKEDNITDWEKMEKERPEEFKEHKKYVEAYRGNKAFFVWTPTSGDLKIKDDQLQYDLIQTTFYKDQSFYALKDFESFLLHYYNPDKRANYCRQLLKKLIPASKENIDTQYLMQLNLLGYDQFQPLFESYVNVENPATRFSLAMLMENTKSDKALPILIALLDDDNSMVQGEAVRQLKDKPVDIAAPILLKHLKTSGANQARNVMSPVMNTIDGGKIEIIKALGEFKYKPAIPELLSLLETNNSDQFDLTIEVLREIGTKEYAAIINRHLNNTTNHLITTLSRVIEEDNLTECVPSLMNYIKNCNRESDYNSYYALYTLKKFKSPSVNEFIIQDFNRQFSNDPNLHSSINQQWLEAYINSFEFIETDQTAVVEKAFFNWYGINKDFMRYPKLFDVKQNLEQEYKTNFPKKLINDGFTLKDVKAYILNTEKVISGEKPIVRYIVDIKLPKRIDVVNEKWEVIQNIANSAVQELQIPKENAFFSCNGAGIGEQDDRFSASGIIDETLSYLKKHPDDDFKKLFRILYDRQFSSTYEKEIEEFLNQ